MTKKDYVAIAEAITVSKRDAKINDLTASEALYNLSTRLGVIFIDDNPKFDLLRFLEACKI